MEQFEHITDRMNMRQLGYKDKVSRTVKGKLGMRNAPAALQGL